MTKIRFYLRIGGLFFVLKYRILMRNLQNKAKKSVRPEKSQKIIKTNQKNDQKWILCEDWRPFVREKKSNLMRNLQKGKKGRQSAGIWSKKNQMLIQILKKRDPLYSRMSKIFYQI